MSKVIQCIAKMHMYAKFNQNRIIRSPVRAQKPLQEQSAKTKMERRLDLSPLHAGNTESKTVHCKV